MWKRRRPTKKKFPKVQWHFHAYISFSVRFRLFAPFPSSPTPRGKIFSLNVWCGINLLPVDDVVLIPFMIILIKSSERPRRWWYAARLVCNFYDLFVDGSRDISCLSSHSSLVSRALFFRELTFFSSLDYVSCQPVCGFRSVVKWQPICWFVVEVITMGKSRGPRKLWK